MRVEFRKYDFVGVRVALVRNDGSTVAFFRDGMKKVTTSRFEGVIEEGTKVEKVELINGEVIFREVA